MKTWWSSFWPDYRTVWRWHFFAGLFCLPFVAFLSVTGTIYLFKPQIDRWIDWRYDHLSSTGLAATPIEEVESALHAVPGSHLLAYELSRTSHSAAQVIVDRNGAAIRVYINPFTLAVLKQVPEEKRFERVVFKLHGQLLMGNVGSIVMEMVASWTIVLIATGFYLWWPRGGRNVWGLLFPRLTMGSRTRWRDLHAVTGVWVSLFLALFLISGLPWSFVWGHALSRVETEFGRLTTIKDWEIGAVPARAVIAGQVTTMPGMDMGSTTVAVGTSLEGLNTVVAKARQLGYPAPVMVTPPFGPDGAWHVRSDTQARPDRISALMDATGVVQSVERFTDKGLVDRVIGYGVAAHEGQLFGWANQVLNFLVASALLILTLAATILWVRRKPPSRLGAPPALPNGRIGMGAVLIMSLLGILLPELGASLLLLCLAAAIARSFRKT